MRTLAQYEKWFTMDPAELLLSQELRLKNNTADIDLANLASQKASKPSIVWTQWKAKNKTKQTIKTPNPNPGGLRLVGVFKLMHTVLCS